MSDLVTIGRPEDIPPGHAARVDIGDTAVAVFNVEGEFHALDDTCSHAQASLSDGDLDVDRCAIECPLHGSSFDLRTGEALTLPAVEPVRVHRVEVHGDELRVRLLRGDTPRIPSSYGRPGEQAEGTGGTPPSYAAPGEQAQGPGDA